MKSWVYILSTFAFLYSLQIPAIAAGVFDFLDPCIAAKDDYWSARNGVLSKFGGALAENPTAVATPEFKEYWWDEKKALLRDYYDEQVAGLVKDSGGDVEKGFDIWLAMQISKSGGEEGMETLVNAEYRRVREIGIKQQKGEVQEKLDEEKNSLYAQCPSDVASQVFRGVITVVSAPVGVVVNNFEAAKNESNDIGKALRATTGISADAIGEKGILGGDNSEARKACNAVAGIFGGKC